MSPLPRDTMEILLPLEPGFLSVVRLAVAGAGTRAGLDIAEIEDAKVAVCEACTNVIEHAYPAEKGLGPEGFIRVRLTVHAGELRIEVEDEGVGFDPKRLPKINPEEKPVEGGLGLYLIRHLMDEVKIESAPGSGTKIIMLKRAAR